MEINHDNISTLSIKHLFAYKLYGKASYDEMTLDEFMNFVNELRINNRLNIIVLTEYNKKDYYKKQIYRLIFNPDMLNDYNALPIEYRTGSYYNSVMGFISRNDPTDIRPLDPDFDQD